MGSRSSRIRIVGLTTLGALAAAVACAPAAKQPNPPPSPSDSSSSRDASSDASPPDAEAAALAAGPDAGGVPSSAATDFPVIAEGAGTRKPPKLAGLCVNPLNDAKKRMNGIAPIEKPKRVDLDGDGKPDWIITSDANAMAYSGYVYITRGQCAVFAGTWEGALPAPVKTWANGVLDLEAGTPCKPTCCPTELVSLLRFDGREYKKIGERTATHACGAAVGP